jgi:hypothetical protein
VDPETANETENAATGVTPVDDCDATQKRKGVQNGSADVDWYTFLGTDNPVSCVPNAKAKVDA